MRAMLLAFTSGFVLSVSFAAMAADPQSTSPVVTAAPEPMARSETVPQPEHTDTQGTATTQNASATPDSQKLICHHPVHEGTILRQQVCLTKHAWDLIRIREQQNVSDFQRRSYEATMK